MQINQEQVNDLIEWLKKSDTPVDIHGVCVLGKEGPEANMYLFREGSKETFKLVGEDMSGKEYCHIIVNRWACKP